MSALAIARLHTAAKNVTVIADYMMLSRDTVDDIVWCQIAGSMLR
jgi:hypothetical protein